MVRRASTRSRRIGPDRPQAVAQGLDLDDLDEEEVKEIIQRELDAALGRDGGTLAQERLQAQQYYNGEPLGTRCRTAPRWSCAASWRRSSGCCRR